MSTMGHFFILGLISSSGAIVCCSWLCWQLLRQNGRILVRLDELEQRLDELEFSGPQASADLPLGSPAPDFELPTLNTERRTLADFRGQSLLLIFFNLGCRFCRDLLPRLAAFGIRSRMSEGDPTLVTSAVSDGHPLPLIIASGDMEQNRRFFAEHQVAFPVLIQQKTEVSDAYGANGTPSGYLVDAEGKIASEFAFGAEMLLALASGTTESKKLKTEMDKARAGEPGQALINTDANERANRIRNSLARSKIKRDGLKAGKPAPDFQLPRLDGRGELSLSALRGRRVLIVFSSPHCGPCNELAPRLERFHRGQPELEVIMISNGGPDENRAKIKEHGLTLAVALQQGWAISRRYAIFATPVAYLIDQEGVITRDVAVGAEPILNLLASITKPKDQIIAKAISITDSFG